ncbi:MAG: TetR/AcrR family transcriptional regulator [Myxococcota bacterium]
MGLAQQRTVGTDSRREILRVAEDIFANKGYVPTTTREIAEAAGVTKGLLFYHFQTKQQLYLTVVESVMESMSQLAIPVVEIEGPERLAHVRGFLDGWTEFQAEHPNALKLITRELMDEGKFYQRITDNYIKPLVEFGIDFIQAGIAEGVFNDIDPFHLVQILGAPNAMYFTQLAFNERLAGEDLKSPDALARRKQALWECFRRVLEKTSDGRSLP